ncbi:hypothetical protein [Nostoc sp.]
MAFPIKKAASAKVDPKQKEKDKLAKEKAAKVPAKKMAPGKVKK